MKKFFTLAVSALVAVTGVQAQNFNRLQSASSLMQEQPRPTRLTNSKAAPTAARTSIAKAAADSIQWTDWEMDGTGTLILDDGLDIFCGIDYQGEFAGINLMKRYNQADSTQAQVKMLDVYNDADIVIDLNTATNACSVAPQSTNFDYFGISTLEVLDVATCFALYGEAWQGMSPEDVQAIVDMYSAYNYYVPELGRFYVYLCYITEGVEDMVALTDMQFQRDGMADATVSVEALDFYATPGDVKAKLTFNPAGLSYVRYGLFPAILAQPEIDAVLNGDEGVVTVTDPGEIELDPQNGIGTYTLVAVSFSADGTALEWGYATFSYTPEQAEDWEPLGKGTYTSDMFEGTIFTFEPPTYEVDVERCISNPALYRIVNPYTEAYPYRFNDGEIYTGCNLYIVFDTTDPERVNFGFANLGFQLFGCGWFTSCTVGSYYNLIGQESDAFGRLVDGKITFAPNTTLFTAAHLSTLGGEDNALYYGNPSGELSLVLPPSTAIESIGATETDAPAKYYNLQGVEIARPAAGSIVIEKRGEQVRKFIVK